MAQKVIHSAKHNETLQGLLYQLEQCPGLASAAAGRTVSSDEIYVEGIGGTGEGHLLLLEDTLTDGSTVYNVRIN